MRCFPCPSRLQTLLPLLVLLTGIGPIAAQQTGSYLDRKREANESVVTIMGSGTASP